MKIPNELRRCAAEAFTTNQAWAEFRRQHGRAILDAEPYDAGRYHRLVELVRHVVLTGSSAGQFAVGDDDASCEHTTIRSPYPPCLGSFDHPP